jgi:hypothetical protein
VLLTLGTTHHICQQPVGTLLFSFHTVSLVTVPIHSEFTFPVSPLIVTFHVIVSLFLFRSIDLVLVLLHGSGARASAATPVGLSAASRSARVLAWGWSNERIVDSNGLLE